MMSSISVFNLLFLEVIFSVFILSKHCVIADGPKVTIPQGKLSGTIFSSTHGNKFSAFMNIPYAEPPVGPLRFKAPVEAGGWDGERDASQDMVQCIQNNPYLRIDEIVGTEDCLYLNVYTPKEIISDGALLPVMVFIHGGGLVTGSGSKLFYGPDHYMDRGVVMVGLNYRLGTLGFYSTKDMAAPGNFGLKDQNMALRWVQKNIIHFGGDPNSVTIFGESAGGASVHFQMVSPKGKGLFHRAISHSGVALCSWVLTSPGLAETRASKLAQAMNCPQGDNNQVVECLRGKTAKELQEASHLFYEWDYDPMVSFKAVVEPDHEDAFLTEDPRKILAEGRFNDVPFLTGINNQDGCIKSTVIFGIPGRLQEFSENFDKLAPFTFHYFNAKDVNYITKALKDFYLNGKSELTKDNVNGITDIITDSFFLNGANEVLKYQLPKSQFPTYFYLFDFRGQYSYSILFGDPVKDYGACHADDLIYMFPHGFFPELYNNDEKRMLDIFLTTWTNFAMTGDPNKPNKPKSGDIPTWKPTTSVAEMEYYRLNLSPKMESHLMDKRRKLWESLPLWHH